MTITEKNSQFSAKILPGQDQKRVGQVPNRLAYPIQPYEHAIQA
jgi:hypothetical protein